MTINIEHGLLYFALHKATHLAAAYKEAKDITESHLNGEEEIDETEFEAAKSSLIFEVIEEEKTVADAADQSIRYYFQGLPYTHSKELLSLISNVTIPDLLEVGNRLLLPVFDASQSRTAVVCHPTKVETLQNEFQEINMTFYPLPSLEHELLSSTDL